MSQDNLRSLIHRQDIVYRVPGTRWDEALPMGDGCFGAMVHEEGHAFQWTINHLDILMGVTPEAYDPCHIDHADIEAQARAAHDDPSHPAHANYNHILSSQMSSSYGWLRRGVPMNIAGQLQIETTHVPADAIAFEQRLNLWDASVQTRCRWPEGLLKINSFVSRSNHTLVIQVDATKPGLLSRIGLHRIPLAMSTAPTSGSNSSDFWLSDVLQSPDDASANKIEYTLYARILDENGKELPELKSRRTTTTINLSALSKLCRFTILITASVEDVGQDSVDSAKRAIEESHRLGQTSLKRNHKKHWHSFWKKSQVELCDKFLETLWYVNLYTLACCDGTGMRFKSQATGLNGLWDIKTPNAWGNSWYWDVNIQQAYWGCYTSNHLEMAKPFHDGLRQHVASAQRWAKQWYGKRGIAADFPLPYYHCVWPWCCQLLWWGYRYSMDENFLRDVAYPIMRDVLLFLEDFFQRDAQGKYFAFPTVSPEQGPMARNSTILLATTRYLLIKTIDASETLDVDVEQRVIWKNFLDNLSELPTGTSVEFGETFKDSQWASPTQELGHSSVLMPIYPTGLIGPDSSKDIQSRARNTLKYAQTLQALGTHNVVWFAAAAARLGLGDEAVRLIYEKGVAYLLRPNGLMAEETDRYIQNCHVLSDPIYLPPMSECCGGMLGAINEMLLQSRDGKVRIFPAIASTWPHARFNKLLAEGALEVSAEYRNGNTVWVKLYSLKGGSYSLVINGKTVKVKLKAGQEHELHPEPCRLSKKSDKQENLNCDASVKKCKTHKHPHKRPHYVTQTKRRVFLGKDEQTEYLRQLDDFLYDYNVGDLAIPMQTKYKFDFGPTSGIAKNYAEVLPQQIFNRNKIGADFYHIHPETLFSRP